MIPHQGFKKKTIDQAGQKQASRWSGKTQE
jgi:hypothetical protein